jgi:hypothetical protein
LAEVLPRCFFELKAVLVEHVVYNVLPQRSVEVNARVAPVRATPGGFRVRHEGSRWPMSVCADSVAGLLKRTRDYSTQGAQFTEVQFTEENEQ